MKPLLLGLSAVAQCAIASAHICDCITRAPRTETYHWLAAVGYTVLSLLAFVVVIRQLVAGQEAADDGETH